MKNYFLQYNVGKAKYLVSWHDGIKKHSDGSDFYDVKIFKNKKYLNRFINFLTFANYVSR
jgi:hypothetical protein